MTEWHVRHEQRGPVTAFSVAAFPQVHWRADFSPQEHLACWALCHVSYYPEGRCERCPYQTQASAVLPQQVEGVAI
jgi:hypothetical protein